MTKLCGYTRYLTMHVLMILQEGYSPLTMAVKENHAEMAEFLLKEGADVNTKDQGHRWVCVMLLKIKSIFLRWRDLVE